MRLSHRSHSRDNCGNRLSFYRRTPLRPSYHLLIFLQTELVEISSHGHSANRHRVRSMLNAEMRGMTHNEPRGRRMSSTRKKWPLTDIRNAIVGTSNCPMVCQFVLIITECPRSRFRSIWLSHLRFQVTKYHPVHYFTYFLKKKIKTHHFTGYIPTVTVLFEVPGYLVYRTQCRSVCLLSFEHHAQRPLYLGALASLQNTENDFIRARSLSQGLYLRIRPIKIHFNTSTIRPAAFRISRQGHKDIFTDSRRQIFGLLKCISVPLSPASIGSHLYQSSIVHFYCELLH